MSLVSMGRTSHSFDRLWALRHLMETEAEEESHEIRLCDQDVHLFVVFRHREATITATMSGDNRWEHPQLLVSLGTKKSLD